MTQQPSSREWHGAHHEWSYGSQCFRWMGSQIAGVNFLPLATEMHAWLLQKGQLSLPPESGKEGQSGYSNPNSFSGSALGLIFARLVNSWHEFINSEDDIDPIDAELDRLRIYNELVLYAARFCEVAIKQLLHCTQIPEKRFKNMALGKC